MQVLCRECRGMIAPDATVCDICHAPVVRRYCPRCSRLVPETTEYCPYCGTSKKANVKRIPVMSILFATAILGMTLYLAVRFSGSKNVAPEEQVPPAPKASEVSPNPVSYPKPVEKQAVPAQAQKPVIDEQKGTELNIQAHQLIGEGKYVEAIPILEQALKSFPKDSTAPAYKFVLYNLGHSLRKAGRSKEAIAYFDQCIRIDPTWEKARSELQIAKAAAKTP